VKVFGSRRNPFEVIRREFKRQAIPEAQDVIKEEADMIAATIQLHLFQETLPMKALTEPYLAKKIREGLDPRKLIANGDYVSEIKARWRPWKTSIEVGLPNTKHPGSGLPYKILGMIHEYGQKKWQAEGKGIPARPHWRPVIKKWLKKKHEVDARIHKRVSDRMFKKLKRRFQQYKENR
jgi:hypothetical protein